MGDLQIFIQIMKKLGLQNTCRLCNEAIKHDKKLCKKCREKVKQPIPRQELERVAQNTLYTTLVSTKVNGEPVNQLLSEEEVHKIVEEAYEE